MRDEFSEQTKRVLAARVGHRCSRPDCRALTSGPQLESGKSLNLGVGAHITAASQEGPRYDPSLTPEERSSAENGIWLCQNCGKLADNDEQRFTVANLRAWKAAAEEAALRNVGKTAQITDEQLVPPLPSKLVAPRPPSDPELTALNTLRRHFQFYMRVVRLIDDIGHLPHNNITNIARPPEYETSKRALYQKFNEDYLAFQVDMETALDLLVAIADTSNDPQQKSAISEVSSALREVATTVAGLIAWTEDRRNEPVNLGTLHERPKACDEARDAAKAMGKVVARRLIQLGSA